MLSYRRPFLPNDEGSLWESITCKMEHVEGIFIDKQKNTKKRVSTNSFYDFFTLFVRIAEKIFFQVSFMFRHSLFDSLIL